MVYEIRLADQLVHPDGDMEPTFGSDHFGSHVFQGQKITTGGQPIPYEGNANRPWDQPGRAQYLGLPRSTVTVDGPDQWTTPTFLSSWVEGPIAGAFMVSASGTFTGTVTLQQSFDHGVTWQDVRSFTGPTSLVMQNVSQSVMWRLGVKAGDAFSGSADLRVSQA